MRDLIFSLPALWLLSTIVALVCGASGFARFLLKGDPCWKLHMESLCSACIGFACPAVVLFQWGHGVFPWLSLAALPVLLLLGANAFWCRDQLRSASGEPEEAVRHDRRRRIGRRLWIPYLAGFLLLSVLLLGGWCLWFASEEFN